MSNSSTLRTTCSEVLMMVRLPGLPVISTTLPSWATMVGVCGAEHAFAGSDLVGGRADVAVARRHAGEPVEVHHLVVEQEAGALDHDAASRSCVPACRCC